MVAVELELVLLLSGLFGSGFGSVGSLVEVVFEVCVVDSFLEFRKYAMISLNESSVL